ncbi:hypothetical protein AvCA_13840 [Azotobacter vinelandii CA]|uniref:DUF2905 domain-containing protein n=2 Tax=Azotobacter vinelandii TaxID=354 RepID=C1DQS8_AZOVD|nr:DUF2905 domain-containing protein [Azotobacter vinelandii]ACO77601.1 conserved hypothetical protein [Azotobacter vinelandii DJ]AGK17017.1 hypothetical protein AvCA_13840 [Azotobacter vinelandii CA]AGK19877.1 hypothetical protein AvCA6_13840 [Azotobacter vinelandii CA6]WKN23376.1 DUF2905 domain-containing protein [Azotobacter vinelandii]SFX98469.1 Protein of unknown function [Azotobacter vinelandii]
MARWLMILGAALLLLGIALQHAPWLFGWFGRLPGDIHIETERGGLFIPFTSMLLISLVASLLFNLFRR